ncbi:MAG: methylmalonyl Co-A mutase-associated GTPase MeaB [Planctomycetota bacterium]|jgi:LAO/AO transport system kinase|nr:methylmalonyl Co-A mutase-associated GTPase MeaB [Planctomycetota bacterium]
MADFPPPSELAQAIVAGERSALARAMTLVESTLPEHQLLTQKLLALLMPHTGKSHRIGVTGVPGVGKSTFLDSYGMHLIERGHRVAVLAVDPSSSVTGGSILGDKSRMNDLAMSDSAFVRPSPSSNNLGGVARRTRENILLCEAAGYDMVLVETVGVGQSETVVADMVDFFLVLMLAGAGDELQGIKKGIIELADLIAINKADGENINSAKAAANDYTAALHYLTPTSEKWQPSTVCISALESNGYDDLYKQISEHAAVMQECGEWTAKRQQQNKKWMWSVIQNRLLDDFNHALNADELAGIEAQVLAGELSPTAAANKLIDGNS